MKTLEEVGMIGCSEDKPYSQGTTAQSKGLEIRAKKWNNRDIEVGSADMILDSSIPFGKMLSLFFFIRLS